MADEPTTAPEGGESGESLFNQTKAEEQPNKLVSLLSPNHVIH